MVSVQAAVTAIAAADGEDRRHLDGEIQAAIDDVAAHAVAFTPTVVTLLDAKLIGDRIFLFVLLADREGERMIKLLLEERSVSGTPKVRGTCRPVAGHRGVAFLRKCASPRNRRPERAVGRERMK